MEDLNRKGSKEMMSKSLKAGKRTYFFDLKETRYEEHYLVIAESKRKFNEEEGRFFYEKHKLFLHVQDLEKFAACLEEMIQYAKANVSEEEFHPKYAGQDETYSEDDGSLDFDDLDFSK